MSRLDLVTGGAGFIGSHLCRALLDRKRHVRVIDDLSTGRLERIEPLLASTESIEFRQMSLLDPELEDCLSGVDTIFHQAAIPSVQRSMEAPLNSNAANVDGTLLLFEAARRAGVRKVVYASSSSVYGDSPTLPKHEGMEPGPISPYAVTKYACELYGRVYSQAFDLPTVGLRYFNVFGPGQDPASEYAAVIPKFVTRMLAGRAPVVYGDGEQSRDFTYIDNVVEANFAAADSDAAGISVNVACGERYSLNQLIGELNAILGTSIEGRYEEARMGDVRHSLADVSLAGEAIGYRVTTSFQEGLRRTVDWFREQG